MLSSSRISNWIEGSSISSVALAHAGVDDEQPFLDCLRGDLGVLGCLAVGHLGLVACFLVGFGGHGCILELAYFRMSGNPAAIKTARSAMAATCMLTRPWPS